MANVLRQESPRPRHVLRSELLHELAQLRAQREREKERAPEITACRTATRNLPPLSDMHTNAYIHTLESASSRQIYSPSSVISTKNGTRSNKKLGTIPSWRNVIHWSLCTLRDIVKKHRSCCTLDRFTKQRARSNQNLGIIPRCPRAFHLGRAGSILRHPSFQSTEEVSKIKPRW